MATITRDQNFINIESVAGDLTPQEIFGTDDLPKKVKRIQLVPGALDDNVVFKEGSASGAVICNVSCYDANKFENVYFFDGQYMKLFLDNSACTLSAGHMIIIELA